MTRTVDLTQLKPGDTVKLRYGGELVIHDIKPPTPPADICCVCLAGNIKLAWFVNGGYNYEGNHPFDIIEIVPKAFDWSTVKKGMAFVWPAEPGMPRMMHDDDLYIYAGSGVQLSIYFFERAFIPYPLEKHHAHKYLVRSPKNDIKVEE